MRDAREDDSRTEPTGHEEHHSGRQTTVTKGTDESSLRTQAVRFIISGVASAVVDLSFTAVMQYLFGQSLAVSRTVGFIFGTLSAYMINRRWTFRAEPSVRRFLAVCLLYSVTYLINVGGYKYGFILLAGWGLPDWLSTLIAFVVSQGTATVANFVIQRTIIFRGAR
ncbi:GtrA family protein [Corynebacterium frankenforstense]|uniref:GtrA family protein n=1 Tax=Corynebacterium frankenforstense TaxID=1230998 RepID=UPI0026E98CA1|nr:GtrA family protein [Corynebacterium frankenforstense]